MNTSVESESRDLVSAIGALRLRREPGGLTVAFDPDRPRYLFVNEAGAAVVGALRQGVGLQEAARAVAKRTGLSSAETASVIMSFLRCLAGHDAASQTPGRDSPLPRAWSLHAEMGAAADRCETFGMPL